MNATRFTAYQLMHGHVYAGEECAGWLAQRKWDGWFALWDGERLLTREGNAIAAPAFFTEGLPDFPLCCELVASREGANRTASLVRTRNNAREWERAKLYVFDAPKAEFFPDERDNVAERLKTVAADVVVARYAEITQTQTVRDRAHLRAMLTSVLSAEGEGLMISPPDHPYEAGRSDRLLKVKRGSLHFLNAMIPKADSEIGAPSFPAVAAHVARVRARAAGLHPVENIPVAAGPSHPLPRCRADFP